MNMTRKYVEFEEQKQVIKYFNDLKLYKRIPGYFHLWSNRNTQKLNINQQAREKSIGMVSGIPDLFLAVPKEPYAGLFIEMKNIIYKPKTNNSKGGLSEKQLSMINDLQQCNYKSIVCYSANEAINQINNYLNI